jgi:hypothetical protein
VRGAAIEERIRELALSFPETYEDHPWGDFPVFKVGANKVFAWLTIEPKAVQLTLKLTAEERAALRLGGPLRRPLRLDHRAHRGRGLPRGGAGVDARELLAEGAGCSSRGGLGLVSFGVVASVARILLRVRHWGLVELFVAIVLTHILIRHEGRPSRLV